MKKMIKFSFYYKLENESVENLTKWLKLAMTNKRKV